MNTTKNFSSGKMSANGIHIMIEGKTGSQGQSFRQEIGVGITTEKDIEALSNAKLWATAPELLEALKASYELITNLYNQFPLKNQNMLVEKDKNLYEMIMSVQVQNEIVIRKSLTI